MFSKFKVIPVLEKRIDKSIPYKILIRGELDILEIFESLTKLGYRFHNDVDFYIENKVKILYPEPNQWGRYGSGNECELVVEYDTDVKFYENATYGRENKPYTELTINQLRKYLEL